MEREHKMILFIFVTQLAYAAYAGDYPRHFSFLTDNTRQLCSENSQCLMTQSKNSEKYQLLFQSKVEKEETVVQTISIKNVRSGKSEDYTLPVPKAIYKGEQAPIFAVDVNNDGYNDIALQTGLSNARGYVFYYWVYNPKTKRFVFTDKMIPALQSLSGKKMTSLTSREEFSINDKFQIVQK